MTDVPPHIEAGAEVLYDGECGMFATCIQLSGEVWQAAARKLLEDDEAVLHLLVDIASYGWGVNADRSRASLARFLCVPEDTKEEEQ